MPVTSERMTDARDAEDAYLLQIGDQAALIAAWYPVVVQRCLVRAGVAGWDVAHDVVERLLGELQRGKTYRVPYRVVVHMVIGWTLKEHFQGLPTDVPLPDGWDHADAADDFAAFEQAFDLERLFAELPVGDQAVCRLRYLEGLEIEQIASRLGKERNAIDQSLYRAHKRLRELAGAG
jgi:RNA polymerase sigma factor (sigma-70 family)